MKPCKLWPGPFYVTGYGRAYRDGREFYAHRDAFLQAHGYLPKVVRHACDNPPCVEPTHLLGGTQTENVRDMMVRGRARFRGRCLTPDQMRTILDRIAAGETQRAIARDLKFHPTTINKFVRGRTWKGVITYVGGTD